MKKILFITLCFLAVIPAKCFHIVGGELFYNCTGNNQYHVTLKLYRNCSVQCDSCAPYINPDYLTVFDANGNVYMQPQIFYTTVASLPATFSSSCPVSVPSDICVEEADYTCDITLPAAAGGYTIVYQRCCRNSGVTNLVPYQGATYTAQVPGSATASCNNSARFNQLPPLFVCLNAPLSLDFSATDPDGDVLVYSLCDPYLGADATCTSPNPASQPGCPTAPPPPPYGAAQYNPPYNSSNFTNSTSVNNLVIDPQSGTLTGTPNTAGLFNVTVCISEYRNGQLLNTLRRDFQFTVIQCDIPIVTVPQVGVSHGIGVYVIDCKSLSVNFTNSSYDPSSTPLTFHWDFGVPGSTNDTSNLSAPTFTYPDTGAYLVHLIASIPGPNNSICTDTAVAYVYVYPTFNTDFSAPSECLDSSIQFADHTISTSGITNTWLWNFGDASTSALQNPTHTYAAPGTYAVTLINQNILGCKDTAVHTVTVYPKPVASFTADSSICATFSDIFTNTSTGGISNIWDFGRGPGDNSILTNSAQIYNTPGNYTVTLVEVSTNGCKDTASEAVAVHPLPVANTSGDVTICPYSSTQLNATGGGTYLWSPATGLSDSTIANPVATPPPPNTIIYTVTVISPFQCSSTASVTVSFYPVPHANAGLDTSVCLNPVSFHDSVQFHPTGGVGYQWSPATGLDNPNIANPLAKPSVNTTYTVTATDANGCTATDSLTVYVLDPALNLILENSVTVCQHDTAYATIVNQGASGYTWNPTLFLTNPASWNTGFYPPDTTMYILTVTNYCYIKSDSIEVYSIPIPQLGLPAVDSICIGDSYQFNAQNAVTYSWTPGATLSSTTIANPVATPVLTTRYIVTGINQYGCVNKDTTLLLVYQPTSILVYPVDTPFICLGTSAPLRATGAYSYVWSPAASLSNPNIANPIATPSDTTQYNVVATNIHGCKSYDSLVIKVQKPVTASTESPFTACEGKPVQLHASGGPFFSWSPSAGLNDSTTNDPFALPDSSTSYVVKVFNDCFSSTATAVVNIHPLPAVDAGNDTTIWRDTYAQLNGRVNSDTFFWYPSNWLENAVSLNTNATPPQTTRYYLFAIDQYGCENIDSVLITVAPHTELLIPTGFSPNGDGVNDEFKILRSLNIEKVTEFAVFDRWGEKVFSTDNINVGWDGTRNGQQSPLGVYVWAVYAVSKDGQEISQRGNVTLIR